MISALGGLEDQEQVLARLLQNQVEIGNAIKPYYGEAAGNKLAELLKQHILIAGKVIAAAKSGNEQELAVQNKEWYRNADDMAKLLSGANPNWSFKELQDLLYTHLKLLTEDAMARHKKDWNGSIAAFDKGEDHLIKLADALSKGIIKQFPDQF
ncbi:glycosyltransferase [Paenibacillus sp. H1-7]|uniref:glycosyltransferase n=1 Tax=Paenibacillus sp. H1-7 TaxID=2282849 RepID=UPI0031F2EA66